MKCFCWPVMKHFYEPAERVQISANVIKDEYDLQF